MNGTDQRLMCLSRRIWTDGPTYMEVLQVYREIIGAWLGIPIMLIGTVTSLLSLWMFSVDRSTPRTTRFLLIAVSASDALFLPFAAMHILTYAFCPKSCRLASPLNMFLLASIARIFGNLFEIFRNWIMVLIGIERYVITRHPLKSKQWWTPRKTCQLVLYIALLCLVVRVPTFTEAVMYALDDENNTAIMTKISRAHTVIDSIFLTLLPLSVLSFCGLRILIIIKRTQRLVVFVGSSFTSRCMHRHKARSRYRVNQVLLISMITFAAFMLPYVPLSVLQWTVWRKDVQPSCAVIVAEYVLAYLSTLGTLLNSTANFFVYVFYWEKYRKMIAEMLCRYKYGSRKCSSLTLSLNTPEAALPGAAVQNGETVRASLLGGGS
uniref:Melanopsin-A n=1 Tax=Schistocephalus solidus TaxID=70667 RepID=A0A0X3PXV9_SCHSO